MLDVDRLSRLIDAGRSLVSERELDDVLDRLLDIARDLTGARYAAIGVLDETRSSLDDFITAGIGAEQRDAIGDLPRGRGVLGLLICRPEPLRLANVGAHARSYGFPQGHPTMTSFLGVPILIRGEAWGNLYLTDKPDGEFDESDEEAAVVLAAWTSIAVENARLYRQMDEHRRELEHSLAALAANTEIARAVGGETRLDRVLELIAKRSRALVEAAGIAILLVEGEDFVVAASAGEVPPGITGSRVLRDGSMAGQVVANGRPARVADMANSLRFALAELGVHARAGLFVPLQFRGATLGVIEAFDRHGGPEFRPADERMLLAAAASAGIAVATAQTVERDRLRRSLRAAEDERRRWARELHDETLQGLGGLRVLLSSGRRSSQPDALMRAVETAIEQLGEEITNLRSLITELRPAALDEIGLAPAIEAICERARSTYGLDVNATIHLNHEVGSTRARLDPEIETAVYRVVQEALNNAARHADPTRIEIEVIERRDGVHVRVSDDGKGFETSKPSPGFGLTGMRERISLTGGQLDIHSTSAGTTVSAIVPADRRVRQTA